MPKDTDTGKAFRKLLARNIFLRRKEPELATAATYIPYVDENKVVRAGKLSLRLTPKPPSSTQRGQHDRHHASPSPLDIPFAQVQPMPPSNSKDKGKARASDADVSDNENASPPRSRPVVHPYASVPRASTSSIRQPNGQSSSSRRSSSPSPLYPPPLASRHASSASSSKSRPRAARVATDSEDEQYEPNGSARRPNARLLEGWTRRNASESRQPVSPLESFREPSPPGGQAPFQSFTMESLFGTISVAAGERSSRPPAPAKHPRSYVKAKLAEAKKSKQALAAPSPALQAAAKAHLKSALKKAAENKLPNTILGEASTSINVPARPKTPRNVHWNDKREERHAKQPRPHPLRAASPPLRMPSPPLRPPSPTLRVPSPSPRPPSPVVPPPALTPRPLSPLLRPPAPPPRPTLSSPASVSHLSELKKTILEKRHIQYEWTDEDGPCSVIRPSPKMTNCDRHAQEKRAQRLWSIVVGRKCGRIPSRRRLPDTDGYRRQRIMHDPEIKKRLQRDRMVRTLKRGGSDETYPRTHPGLPTIPEGVPPASESSLPQHSSAAPVAPNPRHQPTGSQSNKAEPAHTATAPPPPPKEALYPSDKAASTSTTPQARISESIPSTPAPGKYAVEPPRTPASKPTAEPLKTPARKATEPPITPSAPVKPSPFIVSPEPLRPNGKMSLTELVAELAKTPAPPKVIVPPMIQVLHVEVEMSVDPPPQYRPQPAPAAFQAPWPGPQSTYLQATPAMQDDFMDIDAFFPAATQWQGPPPPTYQQMWQPAVPQYTEFAEAPMDVDEVPILPPIVEIPPEPMFVDAADYAAALEEHYNRNRSAILYVEERVNWSFEQVYSTLASALRLEEDLAHSGVLALGDEAVLVYAAISGDLRAVAQIGHHDLTDASVLRAIHRGIVVAFRQRMSYSVPDADPRVLAVQANLNGWAQGMLRLNGFPFPPEVPPVEGEPPAAAADGPQVPEAASGSGTPAQSEAQPPVQGQEARDRKGKGKEREAPDGSSSVEPGAQSSRRQDTPSNPARQTAATAAPTTTPAPSKSFYTPDNLDWDGIMGFGRTEILAY